MAPRISLVVFLLVGAALLGISSPALAVNPFVWNFSETVAHGGTAHVISPDQIDLSAGPGEPPYDVFNYTYQITKVEGHGILGWMDLTSLLPPEDLAGSDTVLGIPPVVIIDESLAEPTFGASADVYAYIDVFGYGHLELSNINLAVFDQARVTGVMNVEAVPEPISICLMGISGLVLICRRQR